MQAADRERGKLEARAAAAESHLAEAKQLGDIQRGGALAAGQASEEREAGLRRRVERLEAENSDLRRCAPVRAEGFGHWPGLDSSLAAFCSLPRSQALEKGLRGTSAPLWTDES